MTSEKEIIITFIYNRSGKSKLTFNELYLTLSMQLNWFTPDDAKLFINQAFSDKLLKKDKEEISPNFDFKEIVVPVGFKPSRNVFEEKVELPEKKGEDLIDKLLKILVEKTDLDKESIKSKIKELVEKRNIIPEIAALLVGKEYNISLEDNINEIEEKIFEGNSK